MRPFIAGFSLPHVDVPWFVVLVIVELISHDQRVQPLGDLRFG